MTPIRRRMAARKAPDRKRTPTLVDRVAYSACEFANVECVCRKTSAECCEAIRWRAAAMIRTVIEAPPGELLEAMVVFGKPPAD